MDEMNTDYIKQLWFIKCLDLSGNKLIVANGLLKMDKRLRGRSQIPQQQ